MSARIADPLDAIIAILAGVFLDREKLDIPDGRSTRLKSRFEKDYLTIVSSNVAVGDSVAELLLPFEKRFEQLADESDDSQTPTGVSMVDKLLEDRLVSAMRNLLNPALPFQPTIQSPFALATLDDAYWTHLEHAETARASVSGVAGS